MSRTNGRARGNRYSLKFSLGSAFVGIAVATALLVGLANYWNIRNYARRDIRQKMHSVVAVAALLVDAQAHDLLKTPEDESSASYKRLKRALQDVRMRTKDVRFVYTFRKTDDGKIVFVLDSETDPAEASHIGDVYDEVTPTLMRAFEKPYRPRVEADFATDKWGTWLSAFAPIVRPDGSLAGVVGMDMSAATILAYERKFLMVVAGITLIVALIVTGLGLYFARSMSQPLEALATDMARIQSLDLEGKAQLESKIQEVLNMGTALDNMKKGLRSFRRYVPAELVTELIGMQKEAVLGVEHRELTVFFSDIADSTTIAESLSLDALSRQLGEYFEAMTQTVLGHRGAVDKFIGDCVMAFWGAPKPLQDHAVHACLAALDCQRRLKELFAIWNQSGRPSMHTRIGLNSGEALVGNMGYRERLSYTASGDCVNLASRLESLNKFYGTQIMLSESTYLAAKHAVEARPIDRVVVKGKTRGVLIYELLAAKGELGNEAKRDVELFTEAMSHYQDRQWREALVIFRELNARQAADRPSAIMIERCEKYDREPPAEDWTGAIYLREK